eukprot:3629377-Prymnesium_polylepis.1
MGFLRFFAASSSSASAAISAATEVGEATRPSKRVLFGVRSLAGGRSALGAPPPSPPEMGGRMRKPAGPPFFRASAIAAFTLSASSGKKEPSSPPPGPIRPAEYLSRPCCESKPVGDVRGACSSVSPNSASSKQRKS